MLETSAVSKSYYSEPAVRNVNLTAGPGDVIGILGPNGSGKTTTVRMLVGLLAPDRGVIRWQERDIASQLLEYQSNLGYVPEEPRLYGYLTAREYLELVGGLRDISPSILKRRIADYLELLDLASDRHAPLSSFSKGMRQKVLIAAALVHDPDVLVFDEPCSGLDVPSTLVLRSLVRALATRGKTIIYSSHVMDMVEKLCDRVLILHKGTVVASDSVKALRDIAKAASLEEVFSLLAVTTDVESIGRELAVVAAK